MTGTKLGWLKARQTMKEMDIVNDSIDSDYYATRRETENNQEIWRITLDYLKKLDQDWEEWYDSPAVPEKIDFDNGERFQKCLKILWDRIKFLKQGDKYENATQPRNSGISTKRIRRKQATSSRK